MPGTDLNSSYVLTNLIDYFVKQASLSPFYREGNRHREIKSLAESHTASEWQSQDLTLSLLTLEASSLALYAIPPSSKRHLSNSFLNFFFF